MSGALANHLWQSTGFTLAVGLITIVFRKNQARVRYGLWFAASAKFLIPFSLLMTLGSTLPWAPTMQTSIAPAVSVTMAQLSQPFPESSSSRVTPALSSSVPTDWVGLAAFGLWTCGFAGILLVRLQTWRRIGAAVRASVTISVPVVAMPRDVRLRAAPGLLEPGIVGLWRPVLLLPAGIEDQLTPAQLHAVLAHELCHIRRRDNLTAVAQMCVEAVFWFHPVVWWIGARLVAERERACDEDVLRTVGDPRVYAEGILAVCKRYVEARLACVSGVSGSDLKERIEAIMRNQSAEALDGSRKLLLAAAAFAAIGTPIVIGMLSEPLLRARSSSITAADHPAFETASIKPNKAGDSGRRVLVPQPGGRLTGTNVTAAALIRFAYELPDFQVFGGPDWIDSDRFDILAKAEGDPPTAQKRLMLRRLLAERFKLTAHVETRELPIYALVMARSDGRLGRQLRRTEADCAGSDRASLNLGVGNGPSSGPPSCGFFGFAPGTDMPSARGGLAFRGLTMAAFAKLLAPVVRRSVSDQSGLAGYFDAEFDFMSELPPPPPPPGVPNPWGEFVSAFTVLPEQLGLKLDSRRGPVEILVIDQAQRPTEH